MDDREQLVKEMAARVVTEDFIGPAKIVSGDEHPSGLRDAIARCFFQVDGAPDRAESSIVREIEASVCAWVSVVSEGELDASTDAVMHDYALFRHPRYGTELVRSEIKEIVRVALAASREVLIPKEQR